MVFPILRRAAHWLGTDDLGRDNLTRVLYGGQVSFSVGLAAALVATAIGTLFGALAGFYRGWIDVVLMRSTDVVLSIPPLPLILLLSGLVRPTVPVLVLIIGSLGWMSTARLVRSQFLSLREREFVEAARALGGNNTRLILRHILPNALGPLIVAATLAVGYSILTKSAPFVPRLRRSATNTHVGKSSEIRHANGSIQHRGSQSRPDC